MTEELPPLFTPGGEHGLTSHATKLLQQNFLFKILENLPIALFAKDVQNDYKYIMWNRRAEQVFGIRTHDAFGKSDYDFFPKEEADFFRSIDRQVMESGEVVDVPEEPVTSKGHTWYGHTVKVPIYDENGKASILFGVIEDITAQKNEASNLAARVAAEKANQAKSEFLANMSHELRTPLNSLLGMTELFKDTRMNPDQRKMVDTMMQAGELLLKTVDDILDFSKLEAKQVTLESIGFDLYSIFLQTVTILQPMANRKNIVLLLDWQGGKMPAVQGDPARIARILNNLIGNAIKYTPQGSIRVEAVWTPTASGVTFSCKVIDTGIGIAPENHHQVFQKFSQADTSTTRKFGGTGLGLSITEQLVTMMGGRIGLQSAEGEGSTFWFEIPFPLATASESAWMEEHIHDNSQLREGLLIPANARLLVAEDNALNQLYMEKLLDVLGFKHVRFVPDGKQAVEAYEADPYDLLFMDCHMPEKNGYEATQDIRSIERETGNHIPIIAMTANALTGEREKCIAAGMDEYVSKPVNIDRFKQVVGQWVDMKQRVSGASGPAVADPSAPPVDMAEIRVYSEGNKDKERYLVGLFLEQAEKVLLALRKNCTDGENREWSDAAHLLKGSAGSIGAAKLYTLCARAQHGVAETAPVRQELLRDIERELARIASFFNGLGLLPEAAA